MRRGVRFGVTGEVGSQLAWRWTPTAEERLLAQASDEPKPGGRLESGRSRPPHGFPPDR